MPAEIHESPSPCRSCPDGLSAITGPFEDEIRIGATTLRSAGGRDAFVAKVDERGQARWARRIGGMGVDAALTTSTVRQSKFRDAPM